MNDNSCRCKKPRISNDKRRQCLDCFEQGYGYKKTAIVTALNAYTVREYLRRYKAGDVKWAERGGMADNSSS